jgi:Extensin-like protein C-terminus
MLGRADSANRCKTSKLLQLLCIIGSLLCLRTLAVAKIIPLPHARPTNIPGEPSVATANSQLSQCQLRLVGLADLKALPPITGPGECVANDVVALDAVLLPDQRRIVLSPSATLRCPMAEAIVHWLRDDVAPLIAALGTSLRGVETLDSFDCRRRNGIADAKISEHGRANALDVRAFTLANGAAIELTDASVDKALRQKLRQSACARFSTVLGNGADAYHDSHVHLDLIERSNNYRICQWDVLDVTETAALAAKKAATPAVFIPAGVPLPRPRPVVNAVSSDRPRHHIARLGEGARGPLFNLFAPLLKSVH